MVQPKKEEEFSWTDAERVELKGNFMTQKDMVFLNISLKGYNPETDVKYAISSDEIFLEIKQPGKNKVLKLCQTLTKQIDVPESDVMLLVDFISVKLAKQEKGLSWNELGYDIANFTNPLRG